MPTLVVPFRGAKSKSRLDALPADARAAVAQAMLADVVAACSAVGETFVVTPDRHVDLPVMLVRDPHGGQAAAVRAGLDAAVAAGCPAPFLVVNADLPCVTPRDLYALLGAVPEGGLAYAPAADGTTNAVGLSSASAFVPAYGPGSAERFAASAASRAVDLPNLAGDVDSLEDLERLSGLLGPHTRRVLAGLVGLAA